MNDGWIKIYRQFLRWEWFDKPEMVQLYIYLLLKASSEDKSWHNIEVKRGQVITSISTIERDLGLSPRTIRTCLNRLKTTREVTIEVTNRYSIITICKYADYQNQLAEIDTQNAKPDAKQATRDRQASDKQATTSKEYKNIRNKEYNITTSKEVDSGDTPTIPADAPASTASKSAINFPFKKIKDDWNATCTSYPKLHVLSEARKTKMRNRIEEMGGIEKALPLIHQLFEKMMMNSFLRGDNRRGWKATFDWLFENDKNWVKVYEGNYDPKIIPLNSTQTSRNNDPAEIYSNGNAGYAARQQEFAQHIDARLSGAYDDEPDVSSNY